jgi:hypothetical protein
LFELQLSYKLAVNTEISVAIAFSGIKIDRPKLRGYNISVNLV